VGMTTLADARLIAATISEPAGLALATEANR
jgi:hypothetical protein